MGLYGQLFDFVAFLATVWRKRTESNPQGAINAQLFSRQVPSPVGLRFLSFGPS